MSVYKKSKCIVCLKDFKYNERIQKGSYCSKHCRYLDHSNIIKNSYTPELKEKKKQLALDNWKDNIKRKKEMSQRMKNRIVLEETKEKISEAKLTNEFNLVKKKIIKERGEFCQRCGENISDWNLLIHHKDGRKWNNNEDNLQILCRSCHSKIHNDISKLSGRFAGEAKIENYIARTLQEIGIDLNDPDFNETPLRVARVYTELFEGIGRESEVEEIFSKWFPTDNNQMVTFHFEIFSLCPHHLLPVEYDIYFTYIPQKRALGLSKIGRALELLSKKPILQENLTTQITSLTMKYLKPAGCACLIEGKHMCMKMRGIKQVNSKVITSDVKGSIKKIQSAREEFLSQIQLLKK